MSVAMVTGATRNLGLALVQGLAERLDEGDVVYLTGRDPDSCEGGVSRRVLPGRQHDRRRWLFGALEGNR